VTMYVLWTPPDFVPQSASVKASGWWHALVDIGYKNALKLKCIHRLPMHHFVAPWRMAYNRPAGHKPSIRSCTYSKGRANNVLIGVQKECLDLLY